MRLFHRTDIESARSILNNRQFQSKMNTGEIYASNMLHGQAQSFGSSVLEIDVPEEKAELNDEFPNGERHYSVNPKHVRIVRAFTDEPTDESEWGK